MALVVEIDSVDVLDLVKHGSISISETGITRTAICDFALLDATGIENESGIHIEDSGTVYFDGVLRSLKRNTVNERASSGVWATVQATDDTVRAADHVITQAHGKRKNNESDRARIRYFFGQYFPAVGTMTFMDQEVDDMPDKDFTGMNLQGLMDYTCKLSGFYWYIDADMELHYFKTAAGAAPFDLSDSPDGSTTYGYRGLELVDENTQLNNAIYTRGKSGLARKWYYDQASIARYGRREGSIVDRKIKRRKDMNRRVAAKLKEQAWPKRAGSLRTSEFGIHPNQTFLLTAADHGLADEPCFVTTVTTRFPQLAAPEYAISFTGKKGRTVP